MTEPNQSQFPDVLHSGQAGRDCKTGRFTCCFSSAFERQEPGHETKLNVALFPSLRIQGQPGVDDYATMEAISNRVPVWSLSNLCYILSGSPDLDGDPTTVWSSWDCLCLRPSEVDPNRSAHRAECLGRERQYGIRQGRLLLNAGGAMSPGAVAVRDEIEGPGRARHSRDPKPRKNEHNPLLQGRANYLVASSQFCLAQ
jgi:hypothetical protein